MLHKVRDSVFIIEKNIQLQNNLEYNLYYSHGGFLLFQLLFTKLRLIEKNHDVFETKLIDFLEHFQNSKEVTFSEGISGNIWLLNYLVENDLIDDLLPTIKEEIQDLLSLNSENFNKITNYDFLHGSLGLLFVANSCKKLLGEKFITDLVTDLLKGLKSNERGKYYNSWMSLFKANKYIADSTDINFSLSHGLPSVVIILSQINIPKNKEIVRDILKLIKSYKTNTNTLSLYPSVVKVGYEIEYKSRLAWCYGDTGVAFAFWQAGKIFKNEEWKKEAIQIMLHASKRRDLKENLVVDAAFCHGTSGLAHIFNRFYKETGIKEFDEARWYWLAQTFLKLEGENNLENFKSFHGLKGWTPDSSLLDGITGIGLAMLGFLTEDVEDLNWDKCLLLS
ncbi:lanthionine synthetase C family protein [Flavobacterium sediminilitoris]|uniref:Lanthionine synthetase C family protein n=1 Tax=Flavobacterium sediminilitoris TaxID=2024526 RepID=A0ABY4HJF8_9FLAO|nr:MULTISPECIES: lanthionine synthetase C family protein [Flavobacterium]UOX32477.1 lanthionine synthetase C family protein [Flavobacterium sediminilitoris]